MSSGATMKLTRFALAVLAAFALAACQGSSPTVPAAPPLLDEAEGGECVRYPEVQPDGSVIWKCSPHVGSGG
jgi:hypothetical protein